MKLQLHDTCEKTSNGEIEMRDKENLYEALRIIKDARQTNFKKEYVNPWENQNNDTIKWIITDEGKVQLEKLEL